MDNSRATRREWPNRRGPSIPGGYLQEGGNEVADGDQPQLTEEPKVSDVLRAAAALVEDDQPLPERIVVQQANPLTWVVRMEVARVDQPYGFTFRVD
jgi:hypothetical protein